MFAGICFLLAKKCKKNIYLGGIMDLNTIFTSVVCASVITFILTAIKELYIQRHQKEKNTKLLIILLTYKLEKFVIDAAIGIGETRSYIRTYHSDYQEGKGHSKLPELDISLNTISWEDMNKKYISRIVNLHHDIRLAQISIDGGFEVDIDVGVEEYFRCASLLGYNIWILVNELKDEYNIPKLEIEDNYYNPIEENLIPEYEKQIKDD
jgi:hypothetical protein